MFVKDRMTVNPTTTTEATPVMEASEIMRKNGHTHLPVLHDGKLVGIITKEDLLRVTPSAATTLSVWELNYALSKLQVKDAMTKNPVTVSPEATLEEAAMLMRDKDIGALPVVEHGKLAGIITESDIFNAFLDLMGLKDTGTRLTIDVQDRIGMIAEVTEIIKNQGVNIISLALFHRNQTSGELVVRLDSPKTEKLIDELRSKGYQILHIARWA